MRIKEPPTPPVFFPLFYFILIFAPLAFATVELWSLTIVELTICILGVVYFWSRLRGNATTVSVPGIMPLLLLLLWMVIQIIPLPPSLVEVVSPGSYAAYQPVEQLSGESIWIPISVNVKSTLFEALRIAAYGAFYFLTAQLLAKSRKLQQTVRVVSLLAIFLAFLAIIQLYTSPDHFYWFRPKPEDARRIMGPWINRSQFAGFMAMMLPVVIGLFLYYRPRVDEEESLRARIVDFFSSVTSNYQLLLAFGIVIILFSVLLSLGRAGIIITFFSIFLYYYILRRKKKKRSWPIAVVCFVGIAIFVLNFGTEDLIGRINDTITAEGEIVFDRIDTWRDTLGAAKVFWATGSGFGTFVDIFPVFKTIQNVYVYDHAHNDYLELITDGGVIGFALVAWFVLAVMKHGWLMIDKRRDNFSILIGIGAFVGICSMLFYSVTDFNMHNGADGLYFFFLCGLLVSAGNTRFYYRSSSTLLKPLPGPTERIVVLVLLVLSVAVLVFPVRSFWAKRMYREVEEVYISRQLGEGKLVELIDRMEKIRTLDRLDGAYASVLGDLYKYLGKRDAALMYYLLAIEKQPLRGEFLQRAAFVLPQEQIQLADDLMDLGYRRSFKKAGLILNYAEWLLYRNNKEHATELLKEGFASIPEMFDGAILLVNAYLDDAEVAAILPNDVDIWLKYAKFLESQEDRESAELFYRRALDFVDSEEKVQSWWYSSVYWFFKRQQKDDEAAEVLRRAVVQFPEDVSFHIYLGDYFREQGIFYKAREEYEQALLFDPDNEGVKRRLERLENR